MMPVNKRKIGICIFLSLITFGVYKIYWEYLLVKNVKIIKKEETCTGEMLCLLFIPFYFLYWWVVQGEFVKNEFSQHGYSSTGNGTIYLIFGIFGLEIVSMAIMQNDFNMLPSTRAKSKKNDVDIRKLVITAMLCAVAYISVWVLSPVKIQFLSFEIKDCILAIGGFLYGPLTALISVILVALLELVTFSNTGLIGLLMNVLSSAFFLIPAALVYKKDRSQKGAVIGLTLGIVLTTGAMLLWNWLITPLYMAVPREQVVGMLVPLILPFNALKASINAVLTLVLYKSVVTALRKARLLPQPTLSVPARRGFAVWGTAAVLLVTLVLVLLAWSGII